MSVSALEIAMTPSRPYRLRSLVVAAFAVAIGCSAIVPGVARADDPPAAAPITSDQVAAKVQAFYNQTKTFSADFSQVYKVKAYNQTKKSSGKVSFSKPGKMRWIYDTPNGNRVISNGKTLKVYEKENNQMFEQPVEKSQYPAALSFLMGQGDLTKSFDLKLLDAATLKFEGGWVLDGTPKEATPAYQKVLFFVDQETGQVRRVIILDAPGNKNTFDFKQPVVNGVLEDSVFEFTPPAGTPILHPLDQPAARASSEEARGSRVHQATET